MNNIQPIKAALISVFDKTSLKELCTELVRRGVVVYSTGGTREHIKKLCGIDPISIESLTQFPEMMEGRVKTLHPKIFGGILARGGNEQDARDAKDFGIPYFDLVVVNLYPFWEHLGQTFDEQVPHIDIGGVSLIRAAAKNFDRVTVLSNPQDYSAFLSEMDACSGTSRAFRHRCAQDAFFRTAEYDSLIYSQWANPTKVLKGLDVHRPEKLRYGENPHQEGWWCSTGEKKWRLLQGKELSYNNLLDADCAVRLTSDFETGAVAIVKHGNPCGVSSGQDSAHVNYVRALECDPKSAFGGIVAFNRTVDKETAEEVIKNFLEVVLAPDFTEEALAQLSMKKNLRVIRWPQPAFNALETRPAMGGMLLQSRDVIGLPKAPKTVSKYLPTDSQWVDLKFAWIVAKHLKSNAIVIAQNGQAVGIGAGQMSRVDAVMVALKNYLPRCSEGSVLASDAFFPFRDSIDLLKGHRITALIEPGGSQRDSEVIDACNELGIALVFTGERHFRH